MRERTAVRPADVVILDDTDARVTDDQEREIYRVASDFALTGPAVVTATTRRCIVPPNVTIVDLTPSSASDHAQLVSTKRNQEIPPTPTQKTRRRHDPNRSTRQL